MAETSDKAFGRYLRTLRERRGLALHDVESLSSSFPEAITKGYLSRCENGYLTPSFSKVIALSRIYEVPADVLVERMELDMELDRLGGPATEGMSFSQLTLAGKDRLQRGRRWEAYAFFRDAILRASVDPIELSYADSSEQVGVASMNYGSAARALGRYRLALYEFEDLRRVSPFSAKLRPLVFERLASCHLALGATRQSREFANQAIDAAGESPAREYLGYALHTRGHAALHEGDYSSGAAYFRRAYEAHKEAGHRAGCAVALNGLAQSYFEAKRFGAARRACSAALRLATSLGHERTRALSLILLGELDEIECRVGEAVNAWKEASRIGMTLNDKQLRFKSDFVLYRHALQTGELSIARSIERRLRRLAPSIPPDTTELSEFRSGQPTRART